MIPITERLRRAAMVADMVEPMQLLMHDAADELDRLSGKVIDLEQQLQHWEKQVHRG